MEQRPLANDWREVAALFIRLGCTSFGGPAAHIALMRREIVERRSWLEAQEFLDLLGAVNLVPGPNSTELAIHIGHRRAGWRGFWAAGLAFISPAFFLVLAFAAMYQHWGALPLATGLLRGLEPVVIAIVVHALWQFLPNAIKNRLTATVAGVAFACVLLGFNELHVLAAAAVFGLVPAHMAKPSTVNSEAGPVSKDGIDESPDDSGEPRKRAAPAWVAVLPAGFIPSLFWSFFKIGSVLYGSGYVLFSFLRAEFVEKHLISDRQLLDAIAIGQVTPGPLFTSATFVGYQIGGVTGALAATIGIFAPAFLFVALLATTLDKLRGSPRARAFLDVVNAVSFALMGATTLLLARGVWNSGAYRIWPVALFAGSLIGLLRTQVNAVWLLAAGAICGYLLR